MRVQVYEPAIWSDASLGCSSLAGMVDQVAAPGFRVMIQAGGYALDAMHRLFSAQLTSGPRWNARRQACLPVVSSWSWISS